MIATSPAHAKERDKSQGLQDVPDKIWTEGPDNSGNWHNILAIM